MNRPAAAAAGMAVLLGWASAAAAHHTGVQYDFAKSVTLKGVVKEFEAQNPHMELILVINDGAGAPRQIEFEGQSANNMYRDCYLRGMVNVGDTITISYSPLKTGKDGGFFQTAVLADGRTFGRKMGGGPAPGAVPSPAPKPAAKPKS